MCESFNFKLLNKKQQHNIRIKINKYVDPVTVV